jgi:hypothetical protein
VAGLEAAETLDSQNPVLVNELAFTYQCLRRYRDSDRIVDKLIELEPDQPVYLEKADSAFREKADLQGVRDAYARLPSSLQDDPQVAMSRIYYAVCARDYGGLARTFSPCTSTNSRSVAPEKLCDERNLTLLTSLLASPGPIKPKRLYGPFPL